MSENHLQWQELSVFETANGWVVSANKKAIAVFDERGLARKFFEALRTGKVKLLLIPPPV